MSAILTLMRGRGAIAAISQGFVANIVMTLANIASGMLLARHIGAQGRGELAALLTLPAFLSFVLTLGIPSALIFYLRQDHEDAAEQMGAAFLLTLMAGVVGAVLGFFAAPFVLTQLSPDLMPAARGFAAFAAVGLLTQTLMTALQAKHEFLAYNRLRYSQPLLLLVVLAVFWVTGVLTPFNAALASALAGVPAQLWVLQWVLREFRPSVHRFKRAARALLAYGLRAYGGELLVGMAAQIDKVIVVGIFSPVTMGLYVVAMSLSRLVTMISGAVVPVLFPKAAGRSEADVVAITSKAAAMTTLLGGLAATGLIVIGPLLLRTFYGHDFGAAAATFRLLVLEAFIASVVQVMSQAFMALNRPGLVTVQYGAGTAVVVGLLVLLAPRYGSEGAAAALLAASVVRLACTYWCFVGVMKVPAPAIVTKLPESAALILTTLQSLRR